MYYETELVDQDGFQVWLEASDLNELREKLRTYTELYGKGKKNVVALAYGHAVIWRPKEGRLEQIYSRRSVSQLRRYRTRKEV